MSPRDGGKSANDLYPVCTYINGLTATNKRSSCVEQPEAILIVLA